jgi:MFS family permease
MSAVSSPLSLPSAASAQLLEMLQRRAMRVLVVAQLLGALGLAAGGAAGALLAEHLTGSAAAAGLPLAVLVLGSGIGAVVVTRVMDQAGRRVGLAAVHLSGVSAPGWRSRRRPCRTGRCCWAAVPCSVVAIPR